MARAQILTTDLRTEAAAEVRRLTASRTLADEADEDALARLDEDGAWMTSARRARRRCALRRQVLVVWRLAYEDASGGVVESCLVPVAIELSSVPSRVRRRAWATALLRDTDADVRAQIEAASAGWREAATHHLNDVLPDLQSLVWQRVPDYVIPNLETISASQVQDVATALAP